MMFLCSSKKETNRNKFESSHSSHPAISFLSLLCCRNAQHPSRSQSDWIATPGVCLFAEKTRKSIFNRLLAGRFPLGECLQVARGKAAARVCVCVNIICHLKRKPIIIRSLSRRCVHRWLSETSRVRESNQSKSGKSPNLRFGAPHSACLTDLVVTFNLAAPMSCVQQCLCMRNRLLADSAQPKTKISQNEY